MRERERFKFARVAQFDRSLVGAFARHLALALARMQQQLDSALLAASMRGALSELQALLERRADANIQGMTGNTPLHLAAINGHALCIDRLAERRADVNATNVLHATPLHLAAINGHRSCIERLLARGADRSIRNVRGAGDTSIIGGTCDDD